MAFGQVMNGVYLYKRWLPGPAIEARPDKVLPSLKTKEFSLAGNYSEDKTIVINKFVI